MKICSAEKE